MIIYFNGGRNRVWYRATKFQSGLDIKIKLVGPDFSVFPLTDLVEWKNEGVYWFDFNFDKRGTWLGIIYENGAKITSNTFHIDVIQPGIITHN